MFLKAKPIYSVVASPQWIFGDKYNGLYIDFSTDYRNGVIRFSRYDLFKRGIV